MSTGQYTKAIAKISKICKDQTLKPILSTTQGPKHSADTIATHLEFVFSDNLLQDDPNIRDCLVYYTL